MALAQLDEPDVHNYEASKEADSVKYTPHSGQMINLNRDALQTFEVYSPYVKILGRKNSTEIGSHQSP